MPLPPVLVVTSRVNVPTEEFSIAFARSSGPGGQNVNKVNSKAVLRWNVVASASLPADVRDQFVDRYRSRLTKDGEIVIASERHRDQARNVDDCLSRLRDLLAAVAHPPKRRKATKPTRASQLRRREKKQATARKKETRRTPRLDAE